MLDWLDHQPGAQEKSREEATKCDNQRNLPGRLPCHRLGDFKKKRRILNQFTFTLGIVAHRFNIWYCIHLYPRDCCTSVQHLLLYVTTKEFKGTLWLHKQT